MITACGSAHVACRAVSTVPDALSTRCDPLDTSRSAVSTRHDPHDTRGERARSTCRRPISSGGSSRTRCDPVITRCRRLITTCKRVSRKRERLHLRCERLHARCERLRCERDRLFSGVPSRSHRARGGSRSKQSRSRSCEMRLHARETRRHRVISASYPSTARHAHASFSTSRSFVARAFTSDAYAFWQKRSTTAWAMPRAVMTLYRKRARGKPCSSRRASFGATS